MEKGARDTAVIYHPDGTVVTFVISSGFLSPRQKRSKASSHAGAVTRSVVWVVYN